MIHKFSILKRFFILVISLNVVFSCNKKSTSNIKISKSEALEMAKHYEIAGDSVEIYFKIYIYPKNSLAYQKGKRKLYYWHVSKECNNCGWIEIDAESGNVFSVGKYDYQY
jgi:hypothetical protein